MVEQASAELAKQAKKSDFCTIIHVPPQRRAFADALAIRENLTNAKFMADSDLEPLFDALRKNLSPGAGAAFTPEIPGRLVVLNKRWQAGRTLGVYFVNGSDEMKSRVMKIAKIWEDHANIKFEEVKDNRDSQIRIGFYAFEGHWSYLGTDSLSIPLSNITMNLDGLSINESTSENEMIRVVLHEFGHALGFGHSHKHPEAGIPWDIPEVYKYYEINQGWSKSDVDYQILDRYTRDQLAFSTTYDKDSCMQYAVQNELTIGDWEVGWNYGLSAGDKTGCARAYPT